MHKNNRFIAKNIRKKLRFTKEITKDDITKAIKKPKEKIKIIYQLV